jgi:NAD(P)-dependent dehydrogenase (short-subunit alcohol dehydrogenase family)
MNFKNKVVVITGAGSGMGRELVLQLIAKGAHVAAVDFNEKTLNETLAIAKSSESKVSSHV